MGSSAGLRGTSSTEQCDLQQRPQHGRHQQCDEHRDDYQSKWPDADLGAAGSARCTAARSARRRCACPRSARAGAAAFSRAEGRHASEPDSARHPRTGSEATAGAAAAAGYAGTAFAAGDRYSRRAGGALGRDPARHTTGTRQGAGTNNITGHGYARDASTGTGCEAGNAAFPGTGRNDGARVNNACGRGHAGRANTAVGRPSQARRAAIAGTGCKAGAAVIARDGAGDAASPPDRGAPRCAFTGNITGARCEADDTAAQRKTGHAATRRAPRPRKAGDDATSRGYHKAGRTLAAACCEADDTITSTATQSEAGHAATCAGGRGCKAGARSVGAGAQGGSTAAERMSARKDHGRRKRSSKLQVNRIGGGRSGLAARSSNADIRRRDDRPLVISAAPTAPPRRSARV